MGKFKESGCFKKALHALFEANLRLFWGQIFDCLACVSRAIFEAVWGLF